MYVLFFSGRFVGVNFEPHFNSSIKGIDYDHIIVECSGVAEPRKVRDLFQEAEDYQSHFVESVKLDTDFTS